MRRRCWNPFTSRRRGKEEKQKQRAHRAETSIDAVHSWRTMERDSQKADSGEWMTLIKAALNLNCSPQFHLNSFVSDWLQHIYLLGQIIAH